MVDSRLLSILVCPWCLGRLDYAADRLTCGKCGAVYRIEDDVPHMLVEQAELFCAACHVRMEKRGVYAACSACGRHYRMDVRVKSALLDHGRFMCPRCGPDKVELSVRGNERMCPRCGACFPSEGGAAQTDPAMT